MKYVSVLYLNEEAKVYEGKEYTYKTELSLKPLDRVLAPVGYKGEVKKACVVEDNIPAETIPANIVAIIKEIKERDK